MKLIFLDVDGVLNHSETPGFVYNTMGPVDKRCLTELNRILKETGAGIVLSSMHRTVPSKIEALKQHGLEFVDLTANDGNYRHTQIRNWIAANPRCKRWAVLDDLDTADLKDGSFFKTELYGGGLTPEIAQRVINYLNS